jgi:hypothetical protein
MRHAPYNQLLNEDGLADTGTSKQTNLSTTGVGGQKIDDLDTGNEHLSGGGLLGELRGVGVDRRHLGALDGTALVDGVAGDVHDTSESAATDGDHDGGASVDGLGSSYETLGTCVDPSISVVELLYGGSSLPSMAIHLTTFSPRCCATSNTSVLPPFWVVRALRMEGSCSVSNLTAMSVSTFLVDSRATRLNRTQAMKLGKVFRNNERDRKERETNYPRSHLSLDGSFLPLQNQCWHRCLRIERLELAQSSS